MRDKPGIYLIKGPPGTGKTTVITNIVYQILFGQHRLARNTCILLTAPSNAAIDELTFRIITKLKPQLSGNLEMLYFNYLQIKYLFQNPIGNL